jgi:putative FmdB family regulatory protein
MPIYEYYCSACGHELEVMQKMSDAPLADCPKCGKAALSKKVSAAGFQLKGSGWYVTDFRDNKKSKTDQKATTESSAESKKDAGDSGAGDSSKDAKTKEAPKAAGGSGKESGGSGQ